MNIGRFAEELPAHYYAWGALNAYPRDPLRYIEILDHVQGMTTPSTMHLLNFAVACLDEGECYLEVGTWRGATFIGAMMGNEAQGYAIDNDTMDGHNKDDRRSRGVWQENIERSGLSERSHYVEGTTPDVFEGLRLPPVGVFLYDGAKDTTEEVLAALNAAIPFLSRFALILLDDANVVQIRRAAYLFCHQQHGQTVKLFDFPTPSNCWPSFWNGLIAIAWGAVLEV